LNASAKPPHRYRTPSGPQAQAEPGSHGRVLRNRLGIRSKREMDRAEYEALLAAQTAYLDRITPDTRFTPQSLCQMHLDWLGEIYDWAGAYRTVELAKGDFRWPPAFRVPDNMARFGQELLADHTPCRPGPVPDVARRIAEVHAELLLIHPFRDGNGRLARWLADLMALQAGLPAPDYGFSGRGSTARRTDYLDAVKKGYMQDYEPLARFFEDALERRLREWEAEA
jgi:cell filamentation protein